MRRTFTPNRPGRSPRTPKRDPKSQNDRSTVSLKARASDLAQRVANDIAFYKHFGLALCACSVFSVPPAANFVPPDRTETTPAPSAPPAPAQTTPESAPPPTEKTPPLWERLVRSMRLRAMKEHHAAFLIQSLWRAKEGNFDPPELGQFFCLTFSDWQKAEIKALQGLPDGALGKAYEDAMLEGDEEEEEEDVE